MDNKFSQLATIVGIDILVNSILPGETIAFMATNDAHKRNVVEKLTTDKEADRESLLNEYADRIALYTLLVGLSDYIGRESNERLAASLNQVVIGIQTAKIILRLPKDDILLIVKRAIDTTKNLLNNAVVLRSFNQEPQTLVDIFEQLCREKLSFES